MAEPFVITALCNNQERDFEASFNAFGFSYRIEVMVDAVPVIFEPDEERNFRALVPDGTVFATSPDPSVLQAIAAALELAFR